MAPPTTRERLLDAAREVVARDGLEGLTLRAIARHAGVSHGAPLRHFASLSSLLAALSARGFEQLVAAVDDAVEAHGKRRPRQDARSRLARAGVGYVRFALDQPGVFSVMFRRELVDTADPAYVTAGSASFDQLVGLVAAAQAEGWQRGVPSERVAAVMWAKVHGLAELWLHGSLQGVV
ncbi:MAG: TetR/AcrR family transcriptional regulator, partial [Acidimicrobiales bacterium]